MSRDDFVTHRKRSRRLKQYIQHLVREREQLLDRAYQQCEYNRQWASHSDEPPPSRSPSDVSGLPLSAFYGHLPPNTPPQMPRIRREVQ